MFSLFIVLLSVSSSLARDQTKCLFLNDELCMVRLTLIDFNPVELKYYPFVTSFKKCTGSCNVLSTKIFVPKETKDINVKSFNMITNKNETKAMTEHISCDCKCKFNKTAHNSNQTWNNKTCQCECKNYRKCICENSKYLKSALVTECAEIISVMDILSTKKTNVTSTASMNCHSIKARHCQILHTLLLATYDC